MKYYLRNVNDEQITEWIMSDILDMLNSGRSPKWIPYDSNDWKEGLLHFTEYELTSKHDYNRQVIRDSIKHKPWDGEVPF